MSKQTFCNNQQVMVKHTRKQFGQDVYFVGHVVGTTAQRVTVQYWDDDLQPITCTIQGGRVHPYRHNISQLNLTPRTIERARYNFNRVQHSTRLKIRVSQQPAPSPEVVAQLPTWLIGEQSITDWQSYQTAVAY